MKSLERQRLKQILSEKKLYSGWGGAARDAGAVAGAGVRRICCCSF